MGYNTSRAANVVCDYTARGPFKVTGQSRNGTGTLTYAIRCRKWAEWMEPGGQVKMYVRTWYSKSRKVNGSFIVRSSKAAPGAALKHCSWRSSKRPVLLISLKGATDGSLTLTYWGSAFHWEKRKP